ncbi:MAG TPA: DsbA family protein [Thermoflexales bacterium]|nr:DsbA family protein [Thermoflexales bacterium]
MLIEVWSDFACPYCYLGSISLNELKKTRNVRVEWRAYELRPNGTPSPTPEYRARIEAGLPGLKKMARERYGIELNPGPLFINTRKVHAGHKFAEAAGAGVTASVSTTWRRYWQEAQNIEDEDVLTQLAVEAGLDAAGFGAAIGQKALGQNSFVEAALADETQAMEYGLEGVPAMVVEKKYLIVGAQPLDVLQNEVDEIESTIH